MAFENSGQTGSQPVASTQLSLVYEVDTTVVGFDDQIPFFLTRGAPRILVLAQQTAGADPGEVQIQVSIENETGVTPQPTWVDVGPPIQTPLNTPIAIERAIPTKLLRVLINKPDGNDVVVGVRVMASQ